MHPNPPLKQSREQFVLKHGGIESAVNFQGLWLFPDGALMESNAMGFTREPPADELECSRLKLKYHEICAEAAKEKFAKLERRNADADTPQARLEQFDTFHSRDGEKILFNGWYLFPDGAMRQQAQMGVWREPPVDPVVLNQRILAYWEARVRLKTDEFTKLKERLRWQAKQAVTHAAASAPPQPPTEAEYEHMMALKTEAQNRQKQLEKVRQDLLGEPSVQEQSHKADVESRRQHASDLLTKIETLNV